MSWCGCCKSSRQILVLIVLILSSNACVSSSSEPGTRAVCPVFLMVFFDTRGRMPSICAPSLYSTSSMLVMVWLVNSLSIAIPMQAAADKSRVSSVIRVFLGLIGIRGVSAYSTIWALAVPILSASTTSRLRV